MKFMVYIVRRDKHTKDGFYHEGVSDSVKTLLDARKLAISTMMKRKDARRVRIYKESKAHDFSVLGEIIKGKSVFVWIESDTDAVSILNPNGAIGRNL